MANTAEMLRNKSENLKNAIGQFVQELINTNNEIDMQIEANKTAVVQANASIEQLHKDNEDLVATREKNEKFIEDVQRILLGE